MLFITVSPTKNEILIFIIAEEIFVWSRIKVMLSVKMWI